MRTLAAWLLIALLPATPSWAGVAIDCGSGTVIAAAAPAAAADALAAPSMGGDPDCCGPAEPSPKQCGSDCAGCHGLGITALGTPPVLTPVIAACPGTTPYAPPASTPLPDETFRPPSARAA